MVTWSYSCFMIDCGCGSIFGPQASTLEIYDVQTKDVIGSNDVFSLCFINLQCPMMSEGSACKVQQVIVPSCKICDSEGIACIVN
jgi:hypothetical protein